MRLEFHLGNKCLLFDRIDCHDVNFIGIAFFPIAANHGVFTVEGQFFTKILFEEIPTVGVEIPLDDLPDEGQVADLYRPPVFVDEPEPEVQEIILDEIVDISAARLRKYGPDLVNDVVFVFELVEITSDILLQD